MTKYYKVSVDANWADEIDFSGYEILTKKEIESFEFIVEHFGDSAISYGTNEDGSLSDINISYDLSKPLKEEEVEMLKNLNLMKSGFLATEYIDGFENMSCMVFRKDKVFAVDDSFNYFLKTKKKKDGIAKILQEEYPDDIEDFLDYEIRDIKIEDLKKLIETHKQVEISYKMWKKNVG